MSISYSISKEYDAEIEMMVHKLNRDHVKETLEKHKEHVRELEAVLASGDLFGGVKEGSRNEVVDTVTFEEAESTSSFSSEDEEEDVKVGVARRDDGSYVGSVSSDSESTAVPQGCTSKPAVECLTAKGYAKAANCVPLIPPMSTAVAPNELRTTKGGPAKTVAPARNDQKTSKSAGRFYCTRSAMNK